PAAAGKAGHSPSWTAGPPVGFTPGGLSCRGRGVTGRRLAAMSTADTRAPVTGPPDPAGPVDVFAEFCAAGLWPGLGRGLAARLRESGITGPDEVSAGRLELLPGIGPKRAERLAAAFEDARPRYETAELLVSC